MLSKVAFLFSPVLLKKSVVAGAATHTYLNVLDNNYLVYPLIIWGNTCNVLRKISASIYSINKEADYCFLKAHKTHICLLAAKCNYDKFLSLYQSIVKFHE